MSGKIDFCREVRGEAVTAAEMKEIERKANEAGLSYYQMMENAGVGAAELICSEMDRKGKRVSIFCGNGNNGGDGFVVARKLTEKGAVVTLILVEGEPKTEDAIENRRISGAMSIPIIDLTGMNPQEAAAAEGLLKEEADLIIDAIYGTGFHGRLREPARTVIRMINRSKAEVYALDIPSGLNGDTGEADEDTVRANCTVVFHRLKPAHMEEKCGGYCGRIVCISIGIEDI